MVDIAKTELAIFDKSPKQIVVEKGQWIDIHPINSISGTSPIQFEITGAEHDYLDLNDSQLFVKFKINNIPAGSAICNFGLHSLFSDIRVTLNDTQIEGGSFLYPYKALISTLVQYGREAKTTFLEASGFKKDQPGQFESATNTGHVYRSAWTTNGRSHHFTGPLFLDIFSQSKYLINKVNVGITLYKSSVDFVLNHFANLAADAQRPEIVIEQAILYVRKCKVSDQVLMGHEIGLSKQPAIYPINRTLLTTFNIPAGGQTFNRENIFHGQLPKLIIFGMVENRAYTGNLKHNPFNFQHFNATKLSLFLDGESIPFRPAEPSFNTGNYTREYLQMFHMFGEFNQDSGSYLTMNDFINGNMLMCYSLAPDLELVSHSQPIKDGNVRIEIQFGIALTNAVNMIVFGVFDSEIHITAERSVTIW